MSIARQTTHLPTCRNLQLPKEVIEQLRYSVFGFDSFFVTGIENYVRTPPVVWCTMLHLKTQLLTTIAAALCATPGAKWCAVQRQPPRRPTKNTCPAQ